MQKQNIWSKFVKMEIAWVRDWITDSIYSSRTSSGEQYEFIPDGACGPVIFSDFWRSDPKPNLLW